MRDDYLTSPSEREYSIASIKDELDSLYDEISFTDSSELPNDQWIMDDGP